MVERSSVVGKLIRGIVNIFRRKPTYEELELEALSEHIQRRPDIYGPRPSISPVSFGEKGGSVGDLVPGSLNFPGDSASSRLGIDPHATRPVGKDEMSAGINPSLSEEEKKNLLKSRRQNLIKAGLMSEDDVVGE